MAPVRSDSGILSAPLASLRIGGVSYLNAMPVLHGLQQRTLPPRLSVDVPYKLAEQLAEGGLDVALAPVATLANVPDLEVAPGICLGCDGPVDSVLIVSERPIEDLDTLLLDTESRTSVVLAQLVAERIRKGRILHLERADHAQMRRRVGQGVGAVVIGDAALEMRKTFRHVLDLGEAWRDWTGLPFVFAGWLARPGALSAQALALLDDSLQRGLSARPAIAERWAADHGGTAEAHLTYLTERMAYRLDERFEAGLREFLERGAAAGLLPALTLRFSGRAA